MLPKHLSSRRSRESNSSEWISSWVPMRIARQQQQQQQGFRTNITRLFILSQYGYAHQNLPKTVYTVHPLQNPKTNLHQQQQWRQREYILFLNVTAERKDAHPFAILGGPSTMGSISSGSDLRFAALVFLLDPPPLPAAAAAPPMFPRQTQKSWGTGPRF